MGLLVRVACAIVPSAASHSCEVWGTYQFPQEFDDQRKESVQEYLAILREIAGVRTSRALSILLVELGLTGAAIVCR